MDVQTIHILLADSFNGRHILLVDSFNGSLDDFIYKFHYWQASLTVDYVNSGQSINGDHTG